MDLIVAKFGGTSVGNGGRIKKAAESIAKEYKKGKQVVVVVSAVNKTTDDLIKLADDAITCNLTDRQHAEIVGMAAKRARKVILVAEHQKFVNKSYYRICSLDQISLFITDKIPTKEQRELFSPETEIKIVNGDNK